jgi:hypothetical protein
MWNSHCLVGVKYVLTDLLDKYTTVKLDEAPENVETSILNYVTNGDSRIQRKTNIN